MRARRGRAARAVLAAALVAGASATVGAPGAAGQSPDLPSAPDREFGLFLNVLPPGQGSSLTPEQALRFEATGERPAHGDDQLAMYAALPAAGDLSAADLSRFFKSEGWVLPAEDMVLVDSPRPGLTIVRDRFGVPHVYGETRADAAFGLGYVTAMDRLFMADVLRHVGRGRLSQFLGPTESNLALDRDTYLVAGYSEEELQAQVDRLVELGPAGRQVVEDGESFIAGINARVDEVILDPSQMPAEYGALQLVPTHWSPTDVVAVAILIQATFAGGGGGELSNAAFLQHAAARHGEERALALWRDLRTAEDPEAPVTTEGSFPFMAPGPVDPAAVALPDPGSVTPVDPISTAPSSGAGLPAPAGGTEPAAPILRGLARLAEGFPSGMSNWLAVTADRSASGHPVAVMGPQTGYFVPEILMEVAVHAPGFDARGATFPGVSLYVLLGRGPDFAWSATSGGSDLIDVRAELLCDPEGGTPAPDATHYVFDGGCVPMTVRTDTWLAKPNAAALEPPTVVEARVERTVHGPVFARGTVDGAPVAFVRQRSTFFGELDSALAFVELSSGAVHDAASFQRAISRVTGSFNWLYVDDRDVAYYHSGLYPVRAPGVDPDLPSWGTGDWEWRGFVPFEDHPQEVNPARGFIASWNNKPARDWRAADSTWTFGSVHRSEILADRLAARVPAGAVTPSDMVEIMADAATVDLRGQEVLPPVLRAIGRGPKDLGPALGLLQAWVADGAHRLDRDGDGEYEHQAAVALMEEWWEPLIRHVLDPSLDGLYEHVPSRFDDGNREAGLGSAFQGGYYGYVEKAVRMASGGRVDGRYEVLRCADGTRRGCRAALVESLREAIAALGPDPSTWDFDESSETIRFTAIGLLTIDPIPWQNRPTFQQVVEVTADAQAAGGSP